MYNPAFIRWHGLKALPATGRNDLLSHSTSKLLQLNFTAMAEVLDIQLQWDPLG